MGEVTLMLAGLIAFCLLVSLIYARKQSSVAQLFDPQPTDYALTIWADPADPTTGPTDAPMPQRITVEYLTRLQADSAEELASAKAGFVRRCNADFRQRFIPMLGAFKIGAVLCQPAHERK